MSGSFVKGLGDLVQSIHRHRRRFSRLPEGQSLYPSFQQGLAQQPPGRVLQVFHQPFREVYLTIRVVSGQGGDMLIDEKQSSQIENALKNKQLYLDLLNVIVLFFLLELLILNNKRIII